MKIPVVPVEENKSKEFIQTSIYQEVVGVSMLSLKSLDVKKEAEQIRRSKDTYYEDLPSETYTVHQFVEAWDTYIDELIQKGEKIQASNLSLNRPQIKDNIIHIEVPSETSKIEIVSQKENLLNFIHRKLNNFSIELLVEVKSEEFKQRYAFTPKDKFEKMREENPVIEELIRVFDLDF